MKLNKIVYHTDTEKLIAPLNLVSLLLPCLLLLAACQQDPLNIVTRGDTGVVGDALPTEDLGDTDALDLGVPEGGTDACVKEGTEVCDGKDNDCNGAVDDVDPNLLQSDVSNCGQCGKQCIYTNAFAKCEAGVCMMENCMPNFWDLDENDSTGCEYNCNVTNGGIEICDGEDNDCDGDTDEDFDLNTNTNHCGACNKKCIFSNAFGTCTGGVCSIDVCSTGFKDLDQDGSNGCEYQCPVWPTTSPDECNGVDDDCDGTTDEDYAPEPCGLDVGECTAGVLACSTGFPLCEGGTLPAAEICDGKDNDCNGLTDEHFNKDSDPRYCGPTCTKCALDHAIAKCTGGVCEIAVCELGWMDLDGLDSTGCEYACTPTGDVEVCDGLDNDCNGLTDTQDPDMVILGGSPCSQYGPCAGSTGTCQGDLGWVCTYGGNVELKECTDPSECKSGNCTAGVCPSELVDEETKCDGIDNDCDGLTDESFPNLGNECEEPEKQGICQGSGSLVCNAAGTALECQLSQPGQTAKDEECNGLDDDCDGLTDEESDDAAGKGVVDAMVHIQRSYGGVSHNFWIYTYEASRPDASLTSAGAQTSRACSKKSVLPWADLSFTEAEDACEASGKRLCTADEWFIACSGAPADPVGCTSSSQDGCYYPYSDTYSASSCNGKEYNAAKDDVVPTGEILGCSSPDGVVDMSGNLKEWTDDPQPPSSPQGYTVRGGGYDTTEFGMRCDFTFAVMPADFYFPNLGFRCCSDTDP